MADEARIQSSLQVKVGNLTYQSQPTAFTADVSTALGPTPGAFTASRWGTDVDLSALGTPGLCRIMNIDSTRNAYVGRWDPTVGSAGRFYPFLKLLPGESYVVRLAEDVEDEWSGTGTGTLAAATTLRVLGEGGSVNVLVEAFEE